MELAPQNMYKDVPQHVPRYRYARIPLNNLPSGSVALNQQSSTLLEWKLSANTTFNLAKSFIPYQFTVPASAVPGQFGVTFEDGCDFRSAYFGNGSGLGIVDLQFSDMYVNVTRPIETKLKDFLSADQLTQFYPANQLASSNIFPFSRDGLTAGVDNAATNNYLEAQHLSIAAVPNTAINVSRYIPLDQFKDTLFCCDKDLVFGTDMYLRFNSNYFVRMCGYTTTPNSPNNGWVPITTNGLAVNMYLYLAIEENLNIRNSLLSSLASGHMKMSIPYTYCYRFSSPNTTSVANISLTLTKNYGRAVKKITFVPCNAQEYTNYAYDHSNTNGTKVNTIQSTMDGRPLTDYILNVFNPNSAVNPANVGWANPANFADDYREALKYLKGSCINSYPEYQTMWLYQDSWGVPCSGGIQSLTPPENVIDGFELLRSGDHVYAVQAQCAAVTAATSSCNAAGLVNYIYCTFIRTLEVKVDGVVLSP